MFNWFPYTNFHNLNLDWILRKLKDIPTKVSQLENDAGYVTAASAGIITSVNGQTGDVVLDASDVGALPNNTVIPTNTSDLINDSGFVTATDIYPVGSLYMSVNSINPGSLFGGTWQQIEDTFLLAAGSSYTAGDTGGSSTHSLIKDELPDEQLEIWYQGDSSTALNWGGNNKGTTLGGVSIGPAGIYTVRTEPLGSGDAFSVMPPYLVVYVWERTA